MGKFRTFRFDPETGTVKVTCKDNVVVVTGRRFLIDRCFNVADDHNWGDSEITNLALGISTDTNDGVTGPTMYAPVSTSGGWQGASPYDWKLSSEFVRKTASITRTGEKVYMKSTFENSDFSSVWASFGTGSVQILEEGVFLSGTAPTSNPLVTTSQEGNAMFARSTLTLNNGSGYYTIDPIYKPDDGNRISIAYEWEFSVL